MGCSVPKPAAESYVWDRREGLLAGPVEDAPMRAADSWLVTSGRVRALDRHRARFGTAFAEHVGPEEFGEFWHAVVAALPRQGDWFPRVELVTAGPEPSLRLRVRPAPPLGTRIRVWPLDGPDERRAPRTKGPDLPWLGRARARAVDAGADEALLTTAAGTVVEGATSALLWWEDDVLCLPSPSLPVLDSVTAGLVVDRAADLGVPIEYRECDLSGLAGREAWFVNALHGIRPVVSWVGTAVEPGPPSRAGEWSEWLSALAEPLAL
ncbi:branched-subunit amino acid aminotransferase/4-amino-4-deoxychorismate lyase [Saccharopolyspora erythraea NRRL 2338]|uniref:Uncharacterized protein n=2 Tax=Saccharopolyspora erythraea TaxID=1836 RepID=A4FGX8_SACEN|nr:hypothetical protein N599_35645 [Saccharopolyspora erythraea D]PFG97007.1 branched-subunit amino acid aminotransferase/4-amino-4-deoxychorismate lyase [Saccharopolyspora erythraea NRRL 2338]QRK93684.1 aminotransferase class IV [Saccharopolyspora erythraea]CAM03303.1 hypothetical protein SACE_4032 [Saccharopolyspora erythraea NRRL 2338]